MNLQEWNEKLFCLNLLHKKEMVMSSKKNSNEEIDIEKIEEISIQVIESYNPDKDVDNGYVNIINIAKKLGFMVGNIELSDDEDGFIIINDNESLIPNKSVSKVIGVNSTRSLAWKRFIIAHEIGHYYLHYSGESNKLEGMYAHRENKKGKGKDENEADFFAACLLMPATFFVEVFNQLKDKFDNELDKSYIVTTLAQKFIVTERMAQRRIKELGLL